MTFGGINIAEMTSKSIEGASRFFDDVTLTEREAVIARQIVKEIQTRFGFLLDVGLNYLTLDRGAATLAGGEAQRIRLATQIGSGLMGVLYILDEPSIGLHQRDNARLIDTLIHLRDLGNTILVVEHDEETMAAADWIIDIGPGRGRSRRGTSFRRGRSKRYSPIRNLSRARICRAGKKSPCPKERRAGTGQFLTIKGAKGHNLKNVTVQIPLRHFDLRDGRVRVRANPRSFRKRCTRA